MASEFGERLAKLVNSAPYREAISKYVRWMQKLRTASRAEAMRILREKKEFFSKMRSSEPGLYAFLEGEDKALSEEIYLRLSGEAAALEVSGNQ
ncbi:MAG: hypothetical protein AB1529_07875 [Candidatus Micrarchaeota archaeon]